MSRRWNRVLVALALLAALATPPAAAARGRERDEGRFAPSPRVWMMEVLDRLWRSLAGTWEATGGSLDPNGGPSPSNPSPQGDSGGSLDPNG